MATQGWGKVGARFGQGLGNLNLAFCPDLAQTLPEPCPDLACPNLARTLLFVQTLPQPCPNLAQTLPQPYPNLVQDLAPTLPQPCPNLAPTLPGPCPRPCPNLAPTLRRRSIKLPILIPILLWFRTIVRNVTVKTDKLCCMCVVRHKSIFNLSTAGMLLKTLVLSYSRSQEKCISINFWVSR